MLSGELDEGPLPAAHVQEVADLYGPGSPAAQAGFQQFYFEPVNCVGYLPLNTERPTFADANMRKAVNYAVDRTAYADQAGPYAGSPFDQYLPPGMPGYEDIQAYPDHQDLERARDLANWHPGDPTRPITVYYRSSGTINQAQAQIVRQNLIDIGFDPNMVGFAGGDIYNAIGTRGEPFDLAVSIGWCSDYPDPWDFIQLLDGTTIHDGPGNLNYAYFNDPVFNDRMHAAEELSRRRRALRRISGHRARSRARRRRRAASMRALQQPLPLLAADRVPPLHWRPTRHRPASTLCVRPEITTDDAQVVVAELGDDRRPRAGAPQQRDGRHGHGRLRHLRTGRPTRARTTSRPPGRSRFAPHERLKTVDVTINSDGGRTSPTRRSS